MMRTFLLAMALVMASGVVQANDVRFATFNTYWLYDDKAPLLRWPPKSETLTPEEREKAYAEKIANVAKAVLSINADILALQEVENLKTLTDLNKALGDRAYPYVFIGHGMDPFTGQDVAILSRFPNVTEPFHRFTDTEPYLTEYGDPRQARLSKAMRVDLEINGAPVSVFTVHLKSKRGGVTSDHQRLAQATIFRRLTRSLLEGRNNVVVMGDLNDVPKSPSLRRLRGWGDPGPDLRQTNGAIKKAERWTHEHKGKQNYIDHILVSPSLKGNVKTANVIGGWDRKTSDHRAVVVTLIIDD